MSDSYEALVDCEATPDQAAALARDAVRILSKGGLIVPSLSSDCVLGGVGYPAGPRCGDVYTVEDYGDLHGNRFWTLRTSGVEVHATPWVNLLGFTQFSGAACPRCGRDRADDFLDDVGNLVEDYMSAGVVPSVTCPSCHAASSIHDWKCDPHLGFVNFALVFWNWPPFESEDWRVNVRALLQDQLKRPLVSTFGRM
jgi:hypothetical protein